MTMEKKIKKIIAFMMTALLSVMVLTACSSSDSPKSSADDSNTTASQALTKDEYVEKVKSLSTEISEVTAKYSTDMQSTDQATMADATKKLIGEIKPIYEELGNLNTHRKNLLLSRKRLSPAVPHLSRLWIFLWS